MDHRLGWTWSRRVLTLLVAASMVWALLLVVERQGGAQAQTRPVSHATRAHTPAPNPTSGVAQSAIANAATAQRASAAAIAVAQPAAQRAVRPLPPSIRTIICAALLRARAIFVALGRFGLVGLRIIDQLIAAFGCRNISSVP